MLAKPYCSPQRIIHDSIYSNNEGLLSADYALLPKVVLLFAQHSSLSVISRIASLETLLYRKWIVAGFCPVDIAMFCITTIQTTCGLHIERIIFVKHPTLMRTATTGWPSLNGRNYNTTVLKVRHIRNSVCIKRLLRS